MPPLGGCKEADSSILYNARLVRFGEAIVGTHLYYKDKQWSFQGKALAEPTPPYRSDFLLLL